MSESLSAGTAATIVSQPPAACQAAIVITTDPAISSSAWTTSVTITAFSPPKAV